MLGKVFSGAADLFGKAVDFVRNLDDRAVWLGVRMGSDFDANDKLEEAVDSVRGNMDAQLNYMVDQGQVSSADAERLGRVLDVVEEKAPSLIKNNIKSLMDSDGQINMNALVTVISDELPKLHDDIMEQVPDYDFNDFATIGYVAMNAQHNIVADLDTMWRSLNSPDYEPLLAQNDAGRSFNNDFRLT